MWMNTLKCQCSTWYLKSCEKWTQTRFAGKMHLRQTSKTALQGKTPNYLPSWIYFYSVNSSNLLSCIDKILLPLSHFIWWFWGFYLLVAWKFLSISFNIINQYRQHKDKSGIVGICCVHICSGMKFIWLLVSGIWSLNHSWSLN